MLRRVLERLVSQARARNLLGGIRTDQPESLEARHEPERITKASTLGELFGALYQRLLVFYPPAFRRAYRNSYEILRG